jgi:formylglycine-generating enzyme required for sulfatase activity
MYSSGRVEDNDDMTIINNDNRRVLRGGGFDSWAQYLRSANRYGDRPDGRIYSYGLRVARTYR